MLIREARSTMPSRDRRSTIGALIVVALGAVFVFWFGMPAGDHPRVSGEEEQALAATATQATAPPRAAPTAIGGGPQLGEEPHQRRPISVEGATDPEIDRTIGVAAGPMDCFTLDGAPYVGTNC